MTIKEEMTTPVAPVGAGSPSSGESAERISTGVRTGAEQSSQNQSTSIIPEINEDFNTPDDFFSR